ncbi:MAG: hypothetical protein V4654_01850 [Bdellovibrionota bacterium]
MKRLTVIVALIFTTACATNNHPETVSLKHDRSIANTEDHLTYKLVVTGGNAVKCAATLGFSAVSLIAMGAAQSVAGVVDLIQSASKKEVRIKMSKCVAFQNKNILEGLMYAGCMVPIDEVSVDRDLNKYVENLKEEDCK